MVGRSVLDMERDAALQEEEAAMLPEVGEKECQFNQIKSIQIKSVSMVALRVVRQH